MIQLGVLHRHYFPSPGQLGSYLPRQTLYQHGLLENTLPVITSRWIIKNNNSPAICFHYSLHGTVGRTHCHWSLWSITRNSLIDIFFDRFPGQLGSHSFEQTHCKQCQWSLGSISISGIKSLPDNLTFLLLHALENTLPLMTWNNNQDKTKDKYSTKWSQKKEITSRVLKATRSRTLVPYLDSCQFGDQTTDQGRWTIDHNEVIIFCLENAKFSIWMCLYWCLLVLKNSVCMV